jgi:hypothetical protein
VGVVTERFSSESCFHPEENGLFLAEDYTRHSSVQGSMESGQAAAATVLGEPGR